jgi:hypothetical protein
MNGALKIIGLGLATLLATGTYTVVHEHLEEKRLARTFLDAVSTQKVHNDAEVAALQARFDHIDVDQYLQSAKLASSGNIVAGRAELARYRALLVDNDRLVEQERSGLKTLVGTLPEGRFRDQVKRGAATAEGRNGQLRTALTQAQVANADAVQAVFDWADQHHAIVHARDNTLIIDGRAPLDEFKVLQSRVGETGEAVSESLRSVRAAQSKSAQDLVRLRHDVDQ